MANSKFEFTGRTKVVDGVTFQKIRALRDIGSVKTGDLGGWLERETNLSPDGNCWVSGEAYVSGKAQVYGDAWVHGNARVFSAAEVFGTAIVSGNAKVYGAAKVFGDSRVYGFAQVANLAQVFGDARVNGYAQVAGRAQVHGDANVYDNALIRGNSDVDCCSAAFWAARVGRKNGTLTVTKAQGGGLLATRGCFAGTIEEFLAQSKAEHDEKTQLEYQLLMQVARMRILGEMPK